MFLVEKLRELSSGAFHVAAPCGNDGSLRLKSKWPAKRGDAGRGLIVFLVLSALQQCSFRQELSLISSAPDKNNQRDCPALHGGTQASTEGNLPFVGKFFQRKTLETFAEAVHVRSGLAEAEKSCLHRSNCSLGENQQKHAAPSSSLLLLG